MAVIIILFIFLIIIPTTIALIIFAFSLALLSTDIAVIEEGGTKDENNIWN